MKLKCLCPKTFPFSNQSNVQPIGSNGNGEAPRPGYAVFARGHTESRGHKIRVEEGRRWRLSVSAAAGKSNLIPVGYYSIEVTFGVPATSDGSRRARLSATSCTPSTASSSPPVPRQRCTSRPSGPARSTSTIGRVARGWRLQTVTARQQVV